MAPSLNVVMYHYVCDLARPPFPRIKGLLTDDFVRQVDFLESRYEMATLESAMAFWQGKYVPQRDLCLPTFDDGLKGHYTDVLPVLAERNIQGLFFIVTACLEERIVASVHKNHFLMAALDFETYRRAVLARLAELAPDMDTSVSQEQIRYTYRWDDLEVAAFKYLLNFSLSETLRDRIVNELFQEHFGDEPAFAKELYLSWEEAKEMQHAGMVMGGHSHKHVPLANLKPGAQQRDLDVCTDKLRRHLHEQPIWPFSYPNGKADTFDEGTARIVKERGFACAFTTVPGATQPGDDLYALRRIDTNSVRTGIAVSGKNA